MKSLVFIWRWSAGAFGFVYGSMNEIVLSDSDVPLTTMACAPLTPVWPSTATVLARLGHDGFDQATMRRLRALPVVGTVGGYTVIGR